MFTNIAYASTEIPTACVRFDKAGQTIDFLINHDYWNTLTNEQKKFVICHECLHVILYHGLRINNLFDNDLNIANQALDIVVNHLLIDRFDFNRSDVDPDNKLCWVDTVFQKNKLRTT